MFPRGGYPMMAFTLFCPLQSATLNSGIAVHGAWCVFSPHKPHKTRGVPEKPPKANGGCGFSRRNPIVPFAKTLQSGTGGGSSGRAKPRANEEDSTCSQLTRANPPRQLAVCFTMPPLQCKGSTYPPPSQGKHDLG